MNSFKTRLILVSVCLALVLGVSSAVVAQDDTLNLLYWQAISTMNPFVSGGTKELHAASLVLEPLARYDDQSNLVPFLAQEIPTLDNGGVSADRTTITWKLKPDLLWSDGTPVTADDVVFTWQYCTDPAMSCSYLTNFANVTSVEAVDAQTIKVTFDGPKPYPYAPFVGQESPIFQKAQFADCMGAAAQQCTDQNFHPIGTGPYMVEDFRANDVVTHVANPNYREEGKPFFQHVVLKGGGDAESAARTVLETGEGDYGWNLQVTPAILASMEDAGLGTVLSGYSTGVERIVVNQTNPDPSLGDMRSVWVADGSNAHPFLTIPAVWQAMSMAIDRNVIQEQLYGAGGRATCDLLSGPEIYASHANDSCLTQDIDGAKALLDDAGIVDTDGDGIREANGVPLRILYQTSTNAVRQGEQALIKQWWEEIGIESELKNVDAGVFFGGDVASPDTYGKFYADVEMFTNTYSGNDPESYMSQFSCSEVAGPDNNFLSSNIGRWCNADYDALIAQYAQTTKPEDRIQIAKQMNDMIVQNGAIIPLIFRASVSAASNRVAGVKMNAWDSELWNIADWTLAGS